MLSSAFIALWAFVCVVQAANFSIVVNGSASHSIPDTLYGLMFESGDGGLYAELLQNRAFQQVVPGTSGSLTAWSAVKGAQISVVNSTSPLSSALPNSLQVQIPSGSSGAVGVANSGYFGINVNQSWTYNASFFYKFAEGSAFNGSLTASLVALDGTVLASSSSNVSGVANWTEFFVQLSPNASGANTNNSFLVTLDGGAAAGETVFFSLFSLFPPTYKNRKNGMRVDLAQALADMKPAFFRFPGGNNLGQSIGGRWIWNNTVGPLTNRPGRLGDWSYINTDGLGLKEYLDFLEDEGMQSIMAVWAGYSFNGTVAEEDIAPYIQEAIDQINFVVGDPAKSEAAALRASLGHPEAYPLQWVEIGNEDFVAADTYSAYRWSDFVGNLSAAFPDLHFLATTYAFDPVLSPSPELYDVHVYQTPTWFSENTFIYDGYEGEYAATSNADGHLSFPIMSGSAGEAAFMTGFERNSDIVFAAAYAPLLSSIDNFQWPNVFFVSAANVYLSSSYYVQKLFSLSKGTEYLPSTLPSTNGTTFWSVTRDTEEGNVFIKIANTASDPAQLSFKLPFSVAPMGNAQVLTGSANATNSPATPEAVVPNNSQFDASEEFEWTAPGFSVSVLTLNVQ
ncbi:glycoside hydrolase [Phellopilus nigrolimitatus]|nr:glycoside hydrolase [Phellopilus nigrolimitatus]